MAALDLYEHVRCNISGKSINHEHDNDKIILESELNPFWSKVNQRKDKKNDQPKKKRKKIKMKEQERNEEPRGTSGDLSVPFDSNNHSNKKKTR